MMKRTTFGWVLLLLAVAAALAVWFSRGQPVPATKPAPAPVDLVKHDGETIDFSSGKPVVKNTPEDRAALEKAAREMEEAAKSVTFDPPKKQPEPPPAPPKN